ncbi:primosomal protein N' [Peptoclostridium acidaminophilum DSM 3953]|uniref:Replication restart protein PriA n=1 Tax=Peptoclostridium acidaminophilum DSM 3953 TaxID=1286171 RepID=W8T7B8_PEPAC|nr:primosomal protein N' [Peptoclostridium acidaminophilum]AHM56770.1 primosomal protein N' [Peptoclostridium acidaminophilum DSM 3953]
MVKYAQIVVDNNSHYTDRLFTYGFDENIDLKIGQRVLVPFGKSNKPVEGFVFGIEDASDSEFEIKSLIGVMDDEKPMLSHSQVELVKWMKEDYLCTYMDCISLMYPKGVKFENYKVAKFSGRPHEGKELSVRAMQVLSELEESKGPVKISELEKSLGYNVQEHLKMLQREGLAEISWGYKSSENKKSIDSIALADYEDIDAAIDELRRKRAYKQAQVLEFLSINEEVQKDDLKELLGVSEATIKALINSTLAVLIKRERYRGPLEYLQAGEAKIVQLNAEQSAAAAFIDERLSQGYARPIVLHGVTGSGKTEVYIRAIERAIEMGKGCIVIVPEIALTPQTVARFNSRFPGRIAVIHSRLSMGEKYDQWRKIKNKEADIVIGARSAIFAPVEDLGLVVIDEFHEGAYKSSMTPKYNAIDVAKKICELENATLVLGSATPPVKDYYRCKKGEYDIIRLRTRANASTLPKVEVVDMKSEIQAGNRGIFSRRFMQLLATTIEDGKQAIILLNRRGYASCISCKECGYVYKCKRCDVSLTYHKKGNMGKCHYCGYEEQIQRVCPECSSNEIGPLGSGTQKIEDEIKAAFPDSNVVRVDRDTTGSKGAYEEIFENFKTGKSDIMIGTQMISKGLDFPNVTFVGVVSADMILNFPDHKSAEKTFQLITQVAGRAGRDAFPGRAVLQAYDPEHYAITFAKEHDYEGFYETEIKLRKAFGYEPFNNIVEIVVSGKSEHTVASNAKKIYESIVYILGKRGYSDCSFIMGPNPGIVQFVNLNYRWNILLKDTCIEISILKKIVEFVCIRKRRDILDSDVCISIDINPESLI